MLQYWYIISSLILGVLMYFPVKKFIITMSYNRFRGKYRREPEKEELNTLNFRSVVLAAIISITFGFVFNRVLMDKLYSAR